MKGEKLFRNGTKLNCAKSKHSMMTHELFTIQYKHVILLCQIDGYNEIEIPLYKHKHIKNQKYILNSNKSIQI